MKKHLKTIFILLFCMLSCTFLYSCNQENKKNKIITTKQETTAQKINILIVPKFEIGDVTGDTPGETQLFYEKYCQEQEPIDLPNLPDTAKFYFNKDNGVAILIASQGKTATTLAMTALLSNTSYDFADTYVVSVGCAGGNYVNTSFGDVVVVTNVCDYDLGYTADIREFDNPNTDVTWFCDDTLESTSNKVLNQNLANDAYELIKDFKLKTPSYSQDLLNVSFQDKALPINDSKVTKGTAITSDSYWKGLYNHKRAQAIGEQYNTSTPYTVTEMEEIAIANTLDCYGMLDKLISLRVVVNYDVFLENDTPETLWQKNTSYSEKINDHSSDFSNIFETSMHNLFDASEVIINQIKDGKL